MRRTAACAPFRGGVTMVAFARMQPTEARRAMETTTLLAALEGNATAIAAIVRAMPADQVAWRPAPDAWSVLEVINHLADEEGEDFRGRLDFVLHRREEP